MARNNTTVFGIPVDLLTQTQVIEAIFTLIEEWRHTGKSEYVATLNVDFLNNTHHCFRTSPKNPKLLKALREARIVTADGMPIVWYTRLLGHPIPERVTGADLLLPLAREAAKRKKSIYLLGGSQEVVSGAAKRLCQQNGQLKIAGTLAPLIEYNGDALTENDLRLIETINDATADILLLNLGNPKQELWYRKIQHHLKVPVTIGVGGAFSFLANTRPRAPSWMQKTGLEWVFRLLVEPKRLWRRYLLGGFQFVFLALPAILRHYFTKLCALVNGGQEAEHALLMHHEKNGESDSSTLQLPTMINKTNCKILSRNIEKALKNHVALKLDLSDVTHIDLKGMTLLVQTLQNDKVQSFGISPSLYSLLAAHRTQDLVKS